MCRGNLSSGLKSDTQWFVLSGTDERPSGRCGTFQLYYNFLEINIFDHVDREQRAETLPRWHAGSSLFMLAKNKKKKGGGKDKRKISVHNVEAIL